MSVASGGDSISLTPTVDSTRGRFICTSMGAYTLGGLKAALTSIG